MQFDSQEKGFVRWALPSYQMEFTASSLKWNVKTLWNTMIYGLLLLFEKWPAMFQHQFPKKEINSVYKD